MLKHAEVDRAPTRAPQPAESWAGTALNLAAVGWIWSLVAGSAALMEVASLPLAALLPKSRDPDRRVNDTLARFAWGRLPFALNPFWRLDLLGAENLPADGPALLVPNHQSLVDVLTLQSLPIQLKWVTSQRYFEVPLLGEQMRRSGFIAVDAGDLASVRRMGVEIEAWLKRGIHVAVFPEGTRSRDGEVGPFRPGPFGAAAHLGVPIVPVAIDGTREALPRDAWRPLGRPPWHIRVRILKAIPTVGEPVRSAGALAIQARKEVVDALRVLRDARPGA